jgi:hypothetical protein
MRLPQTQSKAMIELLAKKHDRNDFDCGKELLNTYLKNRAGQDIKRKLSACFVFAEKEANCIRGYYTLSNNSIPLSCFPEQIKRKLPSSYHSIPTTLLGRLAVDPIDEEAELFYAKYDFIKLPDSEKMFIAIKTLKELFD